MIRRYRMGRRRLSEMVIGGVHLHSFFFQAFIYNERLTKKAKSPGGVYLIRSHTYQMGRNSFWCQKQKECSRYKNIMFISSIG